MKLTTLTPLLPIVLLAFAPAVAQAKAGAKAVPAVKASAAPCSSPPSLSTALVAFGDLRSYFLVPGGDFETAATGWTLTGGAAVVAGGGRLGPESATNALRLPAGSSATSPTFCVDLTAPTFRFFSAQLAQSSGAKLIIDMIYPDNSGQTPVSSTVSDAGAAWTLGDDIALPSARPDQSGGLRQMQLRFRPTSGDWRVDDVLIDPRMRA